MKYIVLLLTVLNINYAAAQIRFEKSEDQFSTLSIKNIQAPEITTLAEAANWADLVAVAQVESAEYDKVRDLNSKGYAFLNVLIPYKGAKKDEPIAVIATGFDDNACYYPDGANTGERFLVFLKKAPEQEKNVYYGFKPFCQMQILVSDLGQYILRTPLDTDLIKIDNSLIEEQVFKDRNALLDTTLWTSISRDEYAEKFKCNVIETSDDFNKYFHLKYTQGVPIYKIRPLLEIEYKARIRSNQI